ncbi:hypothetical protein Ancab_039634 [Ancistrocladus abbreviatus]
MAYRWRGRGRGGYGGRFRGGVENQKPFTHFPEDAELPDQEDITAEVALVISCARLQNYWKTSCYVIEDKTSEKTECEDIERYSDRAKPRHRSRRESVSAYMKLESDYFPSELVQGIKSNVRKKLKWKPNPGLDKMDLFEKREQEAKWRGWHSFQRVSVFSLRRVRHKLLVCE